MEGWAGDNYSASDDVHSLVGSRDVVHRVADNARQCECLAAWDDSRTCICDTTVQMPLSVERLRKAHELVGMIEGTLRKIELIGEIPDVDLNCSVYRSERDEFMYRNGHYDKAPIGIAIPKSLILASLRSEHAKLLSELASTGIISVERANIKAVPK